MEACRCARLNVISGDLARDYVRTHLEQVRVDGMGRAVHQCPDSGISWIEERQPAGYGDDVQVLRRATR